MCKSFSCQVLTEVDKTFRQREQLYVHLDWSEFTPTKQLLLIVGLNIAVKISAYTIQLFCHLVITGLFIKLQSDILFPM